MSYLSQSLRLHFAGRFQATVSTVNNDITHFNNATFQPSDQLRQTDTAANGWWNPDGDGVWRLLGCAITSAFMSDGSAVAATDPILTLSVADSDDSAPAKIVDLDPQQQMVSTIYGLQVRLADSAGNTVMRGKFDPAAFIDLWGKMSASPGGDMAYGAMWQSVVTVTEWGDVSGSPFLLALQASANANGSLLSMKFNVDSYSMTWPTDGGDPTAGNQFCRGRIVGTIGPATTTEPRHFVLGRQLMPFLGDSSGNPFVSFCPAVVDTTANVVRLDLGNSLMMGATGDADDIGALTLVVSPAAGGAPQTIGAISYTAPGWYTRTAGVVEVPIPATGLTLDLSSNPIGLTVGNAGPNAGVATGEPMPVLSNTGTTIAPGGLYVRADLFVFRLSPGQKQDVTFYATQYGQPYGTQAIQIKRSNRGLQRSPGQPKVGTPDTGLIAADTITTNPQGVATLTLTGGDPQNARGYIDGQLYALHYSLASQATGDPQNPYPADSNNFVSILVFDKFTPDNPVTWYGCLQPIFQQYANLYPVMARFVDLGNYDQVKSYARMLYLAFSLPDDDANAMPVTRDLSPAKRAAILTWLKNPLEGNAPPPPPLTFASAGELEPQDPVAAATASKGGKTAAMARRLTDD